jgi:hypothetical protein
MRTIKLLEYMSVLVVVNWSWSPKIRSNPFLGAFIINWIIEFGLDPRKILVLEVGDFLVDCCPGPGPGEGKGRKACP